MPWSLKIEHYNRWQSLAWVEKPEKSGFEENFHNGFDIIQRNNSTTSLHDFCKWNKWQSHITIVWSMSQKLFLLLPWCICFQRKLDSDQKFSQQQWLFGKKLNFFSLLHVLHVRSLRLRCKNSKKVKGSMIKNMYECRNSQTNKKKIKY